MRSPLRCWCLWQLGILVTLSGPARAADRPLLVVVEAPPALGADAAEIRRAIGSELGTETVAPLQTPDDPPDRALIVALDRDRIAVSLRTPGAAPIARSIPAPPERAARLRAVAWLAGNLARDQVSPLVAAAPPQPSPLAAMPALASPPQAVEPPPAAPPATEPPPLADTPAIRTHPEPTPTGPQHWSLGIADGPTTNSFACPASAGTGQPYCAPGAAFGSAWRLEAQRRHAGGGFWGAALEGTAGIDFSPQLVGLSVFVGSSRRHGRWTLEATAGAGLDLVASSETTLTANNSSSTGFSSTITTNYGNGLSNVRPGLSAEGALAVAHPISDVLDIVLRLGAHLSTVGFEDWYLSSTLGLRYNLL